MSFPILNSVSCVQQRAGADVGCRKQKTKQMQKSEKTNMYSTHPKSDCCASKSNLLIINIKIP